MEHHIVFGGNDFENLLLKRFIKEFQINTHDAMFKGKKAFLKNETHACDGLAPTDREGKPVVWMKCYPQNGPENGDVVFTDPDPVPYRTGSLNFLDRSTIGQYLALNCSWENWKDGAKWKWYETSEGSGYLWELKGRRAKVEADSELLYLAAQEFFLSDVYLDKCAGVTPVIFKKWRAQQLAEFCGVSENAMTRTISKMKETIEEAPGKFVAPGVFTKGLEILDNGWFDEGLDSLFSEMEFKFRWESTHAKIAIIREAAGQLCEQVSLTIKRPERNSVLWLINAGFTDLRCFMESPTAVVFNNSAVQIISGLPTPALVAVKR